MIEFFELVWTWLILFFTDLKTFLISMGIIIAITVIGLWIWADLSTPPFDPYP